MTAPRVSWVSALADRTAPAMAELDAGVELSGYIVDTLDVDLDPWQRSVLTMQLDNSDGVFTPRRRVFVEIGGRRSGPYVVESWAAAGSAIVEAFDRRARLSRMHSAYHRRRR